SVGLESKYNAMVLGLRDYVNKNKFKGVLLGLSGGIDSALAVAIAVDALGSDKVRGIRMPSKYSSDGSLKDAEESGRLLKIKIDTLNIEKINETYLGDLKDLFIGLDKDTTEENIQSRIRGVILMAISNKFGEMLISTGNKSEISVGYTTIYGDMNGGFCALKDAYKTDVYNLSKWRNENYNDLFLGPHGMAIPLNSIHKEPSAELDFNQRDQDSLPDYKILDEILIKIIEEEAPLESIISMGYDSKLVRKIYRLLLLSEYKRRQSAPGVKLTARSFGKERRYPITNAFLNDV
ncbi:MAG: NAD(+) synthase, partial [Alphaproteobacteria bacterium]